MLPVYDEDRGFIRSCFIRSGRADHRARERQAASPCPQHPLSCRVAPRSWPLRHHVRRWRRGAEGVTPRIDERETPDARADAGRAGPPRRIASAPAPIAVASAAGGYGGGFIELLVTGATPSSAGSGMRRARSLGRGSPLMRWRRRPMCSRSSTRCFCAPRSSMTAASGPERSSSIPNDKHLYLVQGGGTGAALRHRRRAAWLHLDRRQAHQPQAQWPDWDAARRNAGAPARSTAPYGRRSGQSARRAGALSRRLALSNRRHQ